MTIEMGHIQLKPDAAYENDIISIQFGDASETPAAARGVVVIDEDKVVDLKVALLVLPRLPLFD